MKTKVMGNEQSGRPRGPTYMLALVTEALLPRTDNYILNQIGQWAAQQTRTPIPRVVETIDGVNDTNGNDSDDDVQITGEDPPPQKGSNQSSGTFSLESSNFTIDVTMHYAEPADDDETIPPKAKRPTSASSSRYRSRFASYHKPPDMGNMDRSTYLQVLKRKLPNMYKKQAVSFKRIFPRKTASAEGEVTSQKSPLRAVPTSNLLGQCGTRKTLATQTDRLPVIDVDAVSNHEPARRTISGNDLWLDVFRKQLKDLEADRHRETVAKERHIAELAESRRKVQAQLSQATVAVLPPQVPPLTNDMRNRIDKALRVTDHSQLLVEEFKLRITRGDLHKLEGLNWLNDSIINFYFAMLADRSERNEKLPKAYSFSTFFYERLRTEGYKGVQRWTKRVDVFSKDILLVPVHLGMHWCLAVIDFRRKSIEYYDSMGGDNDDCLNALFVWVQEESLDKRKVEFDIDGWMTSNRKDIPQQHNGSDCGMFACRFAEYVTRGAKINFTQKDMAYFRQRTMFEILEKRLL